MCTFFFQRGWKKGYCCGRGLRGWEMVYGLTGRFVSFCSVLFGAGSVFFFSFSVCIDVVIILRNEGNCIFLTINLKSFVYSQFFRHRSSLDFGFWKYYYENFSNANIREWIWFIKGSCISLYRYFHSHIFTQSIFSIRWIVSFRYKVIRFFFPVRNRDSGAPFPRFYRFLMESVARW